jgi:hypothetical protein
MYINKETACHCMCYITSMSSNGTGKRKEHNNNNKNNNKNKNKNKNLHRFPISCGSSPGLGSPASRSLAVGARANPTLPPEIAGDILGRMTVFMGTSWENLRKSLLMWSFLAGKIERNKGFSGKPCLTLHHGMSGGFHLSWGFNTSL